MKYRMPSYYSKFKCIADKCPETCCAGWEIVIDDKTMKKYRGLDRETRDYILSHVDLPQGIYKQRGDRCAFLNQDNLCNLYINAGEDKFCNTCRRYPRHFEEYGNLIEGALSMSCPVAARMIIDNPHKDKFLVRTREEVLVKNDVDTLLLDTLLKIRSKIFAIAGDRHISIDTRFAQILALGDKLQPHIFHYEKLGYKRKISIFNRKILSKIQHILNKNSGLKDNNSCGNISLRRSYMDMFLGFENINEKWPQLIEEYMKILYTDMSEEEYIERYTRFIAYMKERQYEYEHIFVYFIYTYFLGSVYDYNIQGMIKFAIISTLIIREMGFAKWILNGEKLSVEDQICVAYTYSRQMEHSDNNLTSIEGILTAHPLFSERNIIDAMDFGGYNG